MKKQKKKTYKQKTKYILTMKAINVYKEKPKHFPIYSSN